ncbi:putative zinc-binding metallopeptidase [Phycisphaerales bacterium AB-hyl4]|uniref:Zinc-binding metallopeptidase n=1 Tax=Natronomicrosphaera hydrolytica TaxID=3242702 RepID=A0ABV4U8V4_9BACT
MPTRQPIARRRNAWTRLSDDHLLDLRFCDLKLRYEKTALQRRVQRLYEDLDRKGLTFRPHVWLSTEWFSPDGVPGIAAPFYLAHPRLEKLEKRQMLAVEGGPENQCLRILRHEAGHAIDTAYRLHRRKRWRELFGSFTQPYPQHYRPKPRSRDYVLHLDAWYAQAHPAEDFAETFAVWLAPGSRWRQAYRNWPAYRKLEYVDELMQEIAGEPAPVRSRLQIEPLSQITRTLRQHYRRKHMHYADEFPDFYDSDLRKLFSEEPQYKLRPTAASFLRRIRPELRDTVANWTGTPAYTIDQVLRDMIDRCKELKLRLAKPEKQTKTEAMIMLSVQTMNFLHSGQHRVAL